MDVSDLRLAASSNFNGLPRRIAASAAYTLQQMLNMFNLAVA